MSHLNTRRTTDSKTVQKEAEIQKADFELLRDLARELREAPETKPIRPRSTNRYLAVNTR